MTDLTIRDLDATLTRRLRERAAARGHSIAAEARDILVAALDRPAPPGRDLYDRIRSRFAPLGGADDVPIPPREAAEEPPEFR